MSRGSEGASSALAGAHPNHVVNRNRPHLAVTNLAGLGRLDDHIDHVFDVIVVNQHLDTNLGYEVDLVLRAAIDLGVPTLAAVAVCFAHRHSCDAECLQRRLHVVELERLDDRGDQPHELTFSLLTPAMFASGIDVCEAGPPES